MWGVVKRRGEIEEGRSSVQKRKGVGGRGSRARGQARQEGAETIKERREL